jgi:hypothetical protein
MPKNEILIPELNNQTIESMIYIIRGQKVMLDFDLARIYGYETRYFNRQIKNNIDRFDSEFRFQLTDAEYKEILKCKNFTSSWGGSRKAPYAFTEQGVYMLMTVLKGDLAVKQSKALIRAFKQMKDYIIESNNLLLNTNSYIESKFAFYDKRFENIENKLEIVMDNFIDPSTYKHYLILDGEKIESDIAYQSIYKLANQSIYIIDDYIDIKTLQLLKCCKKKTAITIFTDNKARNNLSSKFVEDFKSDTGFNIAFKKNNYRFHDRYVVLDYGTSNECIYHCGASSKDSGKRITTITKIEEIEAYKTLIDDVLDNEELNI